MGGVDYPRHEVSSSREGPLRKSRADQIHPTPGSAGLVENGPQRRDSWTTSMRFSRGFSLPCLVEKPRRAGSGDKGLQRCRLRTATLSATLLNLPPESGLCAKPCGRDDAAEVFGMDGHQFAKAVAFVVEGVPKESRCSFWRREVCKKKVWK